MQVLEQGRYLSECQVLYQRIWHQKDDRKGTLYHLTPNNAGSVLVLSNTVEALVKSQVLF
jgi:hypothetical protein